MTSPTTVPEGLTDQVEQGYLRFLSGLKDVGEIFKDKDLEELNRLLRTAKLRVITDVEFVLTLNVEMGVAIKNCIFMLTNNDLPIGVNNGIQAMIMTEALLRIARLLKENAALKASLEAQRAEDDLNRQVEDEMWQAYRVDAEASVHPKDDASPSEA